MTVDECGQAVFDCVLTAIQEGPRDEGYAHAADDIRTNLQDLLYTESVRAAAMLWQRREWILKYKAATLQDLKIDGVGTMTRCLEQLHDEILRTSPGKGGG